MTQRTQITIYGKTYTIKIPSEDADPQELAEFVDSQMQALSGGSTKVSTLDLAVLTALNIAQELFLIRKEMESSQKDNTAFQNDWNQRCESLVNQIKTILPDPH